MSDTPLAPPIQTKSRNRHLGYLDSLRGIAILLVLWVHAGIAGQAPAHSRIWPLFFVGQRGVELFYETSAFTLFLSLSQGRREHSPVRNFYLRRFFRIAPAFYLALLLEYVLVGHRVAERWRYVLAATFLSGWSPRAINLSVIGAWSVAVEAMFYTTVPFLFRRVRGVRGALAFFLGSWAVTRALDTVLVHAFRHSMEGEYLTLLWPVAQLPVFAIGILAFRVYEVLVGWRETYPGFWTEDVRKGMSALLLLVSAVLFRSNLGRANGYLVEGSLCFGTLLLAGDLYAWPMLFNRPMAWVGKISFSVYLLHFFLVSPVYGALARWIPGTSSEAAVLRSVCALGMLIGISLPVCWVMWRWVEVPGIALGRALIAKLEGREDAQTPLPVDAQMSSPGFQF